MEKKTIRDIDVAGKRVLVRVDFNVPLDGQQHITDDTRIKAALSTISYLLERHVAVILMSHLGRPKGQVVETMRLAPVARRLGELLGQHIETASDCIGPEVEHAAQTLLPGQVLLLENLRFHKEEEKNDPDFARKLATLGQIYVNDAFGTAHRAHASTEGVTHFLPSVAGFLMEKELSFLGTALEHPRHPFVAIIGGAKISDKIAVLDRLTGMVDVLLIGGGMANTFLKAKGYEVGDSLVEDEQLNAARTVLAKARTSLLTLVLPVDAVIATDVSAGASSRIVPIDQVPQGWRILDIGPQTIAAFRKTLVDARTIVWNGTLGVAELAPFAKGTGAVITMLVERTRQGATTIIGGGDSGAAVAKIGASEKMTHISTGGGASLELLEGRVLPGVAALQEKEVYRSLAYRKEVHRSLVHR